MSGPEGGWHRALADLLDAAHLMQPTALTTVVNQVVRPLGADITVFLVDREQRSLRALAEPGKPARPPVPVESTGPGWAFMTSRIVTAPGRGDQLWVPVVDGTERLGVADVHLPAEMSADDPPVRAGVAALVGLVGHLVMAKSAYGDSLRVARRSRPMSTEGELLWRNLPPLTFATEDLVITAVLEPCYQVGGDAFDYAVDDDVARLAIFDAVGHGLRAGLTSVLTLAATRSARTGGADLNEMAAAADAALTSQFDDVRYTTAFLAELNLDDGLLRYVNAGHPAPVLLRGGRAVAELDSGRRMPLGLGDSAPLLSEYPLQEGDRILLYTDGITEARDQDGSLFGVDRLIDLAERNLAEGRSLPETLRRVSHAVLDHQHHARQDDATLMLVEWAAHAGQRVRP